MTLKTAAARSAKPAPDHAPTPMSFRCGPVTAESIRTAAAAERRKPTAFMRNCVEQWLQLNGYPVDPV